MIQQKHIDLMNQELDGINTPRQSAELEDILKEHDEARTYYRELTLALDVFEKVPLLTPPPELAPDILARLEQRPDESVQNGGRDTGQDLWAACRETLHRGWRYRPRPAFAFTFVAGLVFGLVLYAGSMHLASDRNFDPNGQLSATANHRGWGPQAVTDNQLSVPGLEGRVRTQRAGQDIRLHLELQADLPAMIQISHGPHTDLKQYQTTNPDPAGLSVSSAGMEISHQGRGSYDLVFFQDTADMTPILMSIFSEGRLVHRETLAGQEK